MAIAPGIFFRFERARKKFMTFRNATVSFCKQRWQFLHRWHVHRGLGALRARVSKVHLKPQKLQSWGRGDSSLQYEPVLCFSNAGMQKSLTAKVQ